MSYVVKNHDVDGVSSWRYRSLAGARKRFEAMYGYSCEAAIAERFYEIEQSGGQLPKLEELKYLRAVGMYGNVVELAKREVIE